MGDYGSTSSPIPVNGTHLGSPDRMLLQSGRS